MINIEEEVFGIVAAKVREEYPKASVVGEYVKAPPSFPCVMLVEMDNHPDVSTQTTDCMENHAIVMYEVNVYSNKTKGKKAECKAIAALVDSELARLGFTRTMLNPIPNMDDATIYRMLGRYTAKVSKNNVIYRR
ncbi:MAG: hypothetical protein NC489_34075 [Ruminococcus flavefaciens]|nr:hypothetical protein [Ruminococcus flavefaciens]